MFPFNNLFAKSTLSVTALLIASISFVSVGRANAPSLVVDGKNVGLSSPVLIQNGHTLASVREIAQALGAEISWEENTKTVSATRGNKSFALTIGADFITVNSASQPLDIPAKIINHQAYAPLNAIAGAFDYSAQWYAHDNSIVLKDESPNAKRLDISLTHGFSTSLTENEATETAKRRNTSLKTLTSRMNDMELARDDLADQLATLDKRAASLPPEYLVQLNSSMLDILSSLESVQFTLSTEKYQREITEGALALSIKSSFLSIINRQSDIKIAKAQAQLSEKALEHSKLMHELGMLSANDYEKAVLSHEQLKSSITVLERALTTEYQALNKLLGNNAESRFNVVFKDDFMPLDDDFRINNYVTTATSASPSVKLAEITLEKAETDALLMMPLSISQYRQGQTNIAVEEMNLNETKREHEKNIRDAYYELKDIETQIKTSELDADKAQTALLTAQAQFETGAATELELLGKMLDADIAKRKTELLKMSHSLRRFMFENPFLL